MSLRDAVQELVELGASGTLFRIGWEARLRAGLVRVSEPRTTDLGEANALGRLPWPSSTSVAAAMEGRIPKDAVARLVRTADEATRGRILCFGEWTAELGEPLDWHKNPANGERWPSSVPWSRALADEPRVGDVKLTWEPARFPHAFHFARAATFEPSRRDAFALAFERQVRSFVEATPFARGVHWFSAQESVQRVLAWLFAQPALTPSGGLLHATAVMAARTVAQIEALIEYSERAVYNNHLLAEALGLLALPRVFPGIADSDALRRRGLEILEREADHQFDRDGAYIAHSHNYARTALAHLLVAVAFLRKDGALVPSSILGALERALRFLVQHENPSDGRLPNFGWNDGSMPYVLSTCAFADFRPLLQTLSLATRGERLYESGPWDEMAAWLVGPESLDAPRRDPARRSFGFSRAGYFVLRGRDPRSFSTLRCGTLQDRFAQIDMLHADIWWRGQNVAVDGGTYLYNGPAEWNAHFTRTGSHNTVTVDGRDQMLHHRRFKLVHWTHARSLFFRDDAATARVAGEHYGFQRYPGACVHRRSVLFVKDDLWVVVDRVTGHGSHTARLHWLAGDFPYRVERDRLILATPEGDFSIAVFDRSGLPLGRNVVRGQEQPPRGWLSRTYATKVPVPSLEAVSSGEVPLTFVSVLGAGEPAPSVSGGVWTIGATRFEIVDGLVALVP